MTQQYKYIEITPYTTNDHCIVCNAQQKTQHSTKHQHNNMTPQ